MPSLLNVENLAIQFGSGDELVRAVDGISFSMAAGETLVIRLLISLENFRTK